ncbi:MAG: glycosyltransferase family 39 protein [Candidatus Marinimicrobia bacterium]|nr:glycosyltransferase family 39 protein [Candidatus Neomarinimicrobiota bacterium]
MNFKKILFVILALNLIFRIGYILIGVDNSKYYFEDTIHYYSAAESIVDNGNFGVDPERPPTPFGLEPGYPLFLALIVFIFGKGFLWIRIVQSIIITLSGYIFYKTLRMFVDERFSMLGTIYYLFYPFYIFFSGFLYPESIYMPLLVTFVYFFFRYYNNSRINDFLVSVFVLVIMYHTKAPSIVLFPILFGLPIYMKIKKRENKVYLKIILGLILFILISTPWLVRNYKVYHSITITRNYTRKSFEQEDNIKKSGHGSAKNYINEKLSELKFSKFVDQVKRYYSPFFDEVQKNSNFYDEINSKQNKKRIILRSISFIFTIPWLIAFVVLPIFKNNGKEILLIYVTAIFLAMPFIILHSNTRYRLPTDFLYLMIFTIFVKKLFEKFKHEKITDN